MVISLTLFQLGAGVSSAPFQTFLHFSEISKALVSRNFVTFPKTSDKIYKNFLKNFASGSPSAVKDQLLVFSKN